MYIAAKVVAFLFSLLLWIVPPVYLDYHVTLVLLTEAIDHCSCDVRLFCS